MERDEKKGTMFAKWLLVVVGQFESETVTQTRNWNEAGKVVNAAPPRTYCRGEAFQTNPLCKQENSSLSAAVPPAA